MRISIDIDGVIARFTDQVVGVANKLWPGRMPDNYEPKNWDYTDTLSKGDWGKIWDEIDATDNFWVQSQPYRENVEDLTSYLNKPGRDVFFVTSRKQTKGDPVQTQTWRWFKKQDLPVGTYQFDYNFCPVVPVANPKLKKQIMEGLGIQMSVDDYGPTVEMCNEIPGHKAYVLDRPWNRDKNYGPRAYTLKEFLEKT